MSEGLTRRATGPCRRPGGRSGARRRSRLRLAHSRHREDGCEGQLLRYGCSFQSPQSLTETEWGLAYHLGSPYISIGPIVRNDGYCALLWRGHLPDGTSVVTGTDIAQIEGGSPVSIDTKQESHDTHPARRPEILRRSSMPTQQEEAL